MRILNTFTGHLVLLGLTLLLGQGAATDIGVERDNLASDEERRELSGEELLKLVPEVASVLLSAANPREGGTGVDIRARDGQTGSGDLAHSSGDEPGNKSLEADTFASVLVGHTASPAGDVGLGSTIDGDESRRLQISRGGGQVHDESELLFLHLRQNNASHVVHGVDVDFDDVTSTLLIDFEEIGSMIIRETNVVD